MPRSLLQALYATKDAGRHALRRASHAMAPPYCSHTAHAKLLTRNDTTLSRHPLWLLGATGVTISALFMPTFADPYYKLTFFYKSTRFNVIVFVILFVYLQRVSNYDISLSF